MTHFARISCTVMVCYPIHIHLYGFCCYSCTHFAWPSLLHNLTLPTCTCSAHTVLGSIVLLYIYTLVSLCHCVHNCTVQLYTRKQRQLQVIVYRCTVLLYRTSPAFSSKQQPLQFLVVPVHEGYLKVHEGYLLVQRGYMFSIRHVDTALLPCRMGCVKKHMKDENDSITTFLLFN